MTSQLNSFVKSGTYEWALPKNRKPLGTYEMGLFRIKTSTDGKATNKARLLAKGCRQKEGIDYQETFSPVIDSSLRYLFALAVKENLKIFHADVASAYLHGQLSEETYVTPPDEAVKNKEHQGMVWKLKKKFRAAEFSSARSSKSFLT